MSYNSKYTGTQVEDAINKALSATQPTDLAKVATSGSYNDLKDKPIIPSEVKVDASLSTTSTNPVQNKAVATGINAKYTKPSTGIPKSDLASAVQTSLGKADTATQTIFFTNISASSWVADSTYSDYGYRCDVACNGVTANDFAEVVFDVAQARSGDYAPICETKTNIVSVWSSKNDAITIPTIIITK